jgi:hypothetical protein
MMRYLPASGTAGFERSRVRGYRRVPRPPPSTKANTLLTLIQVTFRVDATLAKIDSCHLPPKIPLHECYAAKASEPNNIR